MGVGEGDAEALGVASSAEDLVTAETAFAIPHTTSAMITSNPSPVTIRLTHREGGTCPPPGFLGGVPPERTVGRAPGRPARGVRERDVEAEEARERDVEAEEDRGLLGMRLPSPLRYIALTSIPLRPKSALVTPSARLHRLSVIILWVNDAPAFNDHSGNAPQTSTERTHQSANSSVNTGLCFPASEEGQ